jgi:hypothetical protein
MSEGLQRAAIAFKSVDWVVPAYFTVGHISMVGAAIERADEGSKQDVLRVVLPRMYTPDALAAMLLGLYSHSVHVSDFRAAISDSIEAAVCGLWHAAVTTLVPVIEGVIKKISAEHVEPLPKGQKSWIVAELDELLAREERSPHRYEERVVMLTGLRDFCAQRLYIKTEKYQGLNRLNRHGILHGLFDDFGDEVNFYRLISILDLLCFAIKLKHGGSGFAPETTPESERLAAYYRTIQATALSRPMPNI